MYRAAAPRGSLLRPLTHNITPRPCFTQSFARFSTQGKLSKLVKPTVRSDKLALTAYRPNTALIRSYASVHGTTRDSSIEEKARESTLEPHPELVSSISSTHPAFQEVQVADKEKEENTDMLAGIRHDIVRILNDGPIIQLTNQHTLLGRDRRYVQRQRCTERSPAHWFSWCHSISGHVHCHRCLCFRAQRSRPQRHWISHERAERGSSLARLGAFAGRIWRSRMHIIRYL